MPTTSLLTENCQGNITFPKSKSITTLRYHSAPVLPVIYGLYTADLYTVPVTSDLKSVSSIWSKAIRTIKRWVYKKRKHSIKFMDEEKFYCYGFWRGGTWAEIEMTENNWTISLKGPGWRTHSLHNGNKKVIVINHRRSSGGMLSLSMNQSHPFNSRIMWKLEIVTRASAVLTLLCGIMSKSIIKTTDFW